MSDLSDAMSELKDAYQDVTDSAPTLTHDGETVECMPQAMLNDFRFIHGGEGDKGRFQVATLRSDWDTPPECSDTVTLADHATADDGDYHVLSRTPYEAWWVFTLGDLTAE